MLRRAAASRRPSSRLLLVLAVTLHGTLPIDCFLTQALWQHPPCTPRPSVVQRRCHADTRRSDRPVDPPHSDSPAHLHAYHVHVSVMHHCLKAVARCLVSMMVRCELIETCMVRADLGCSVHGCCVGVGVHVWVPTGDQPPCLICATGCARELHPPGVDQKSVEVSCNRLK